MSTILFIITLGILWVGYRWYGNYISGRVGFDSHFRTPAFTKYDGVDYVPAKSWLVLFGHHFASIAGAGPIVGPVLAYMYWGWIGALIWIILGSIFIGGVHDFLSLLISVREEGKTIGRIAEKYISKRASKVFLLFLWFALVIVVAVFASLCAKSFINQPQVVLPSLGLIPLAILLGVLIYVLRVNIYLATILGVFFLGVLVILGNYFPISISMGDPYLTWMVVLFIYAFFASILPVNILLQPRDYISSFLLFFGIGVAVIGLASKPIPIEGTKLFVFPSKLGPFFPIMFITVACGAISGFHSLVSSGTTSKQLSSEKDAKRIGYGAMLLEGVLATIALFCVAFGVKTVSPQKSAIEIFSLGFSKIVYFLGDYGKVIGVVILNAFILTTLDTATRITRFLTQELLNIGNKWLATFIVILVGGYLGITGKWQNLWPIFGASNQLVAALALIVISAWLISRKKNYGISLIPALVMVVITIYALVYKSIFFYRQKNYLLLLISCILIFLAGFVIIEFKNLKRAKKNA